MVDLDTECPNCGISQADREAEFAIISKGFGMLECPICDYIWREVTDVPEEEG